MLDSFGDGFIAFDFDWRITHCNRGGAALHGRDREAIIGHVAWEVPGLRDDTELRAFVEGAAQAGVAVDAEVPSELHPGRWFYLRAFPLEGGIGLISRDITERHEQARREREQALREREQSQRLELALATAGFGDWRWDAASDIVVFSPRAAAIAGAPDGEVMTWTEQLERLHPDDRERARQSVRSALADRTPYEIEYRFFRPSDGAERWMMVRAMGQYADDGTPLGMLGVLTDVTEAKAEAERIRADRARLAESEARFRTMADSAPSPVWVTDARGGLEFANRAYREATGRPLEELVGGGWFDMVHPEDRAALFEARSERRELSLPHGYEARFLLAGGEWRWLRIAARARFDDAGEFQGYVSLAMDITETRRAEERQKLLMNELNHRVKNTLATIQSLARQTLRDGVSIADGRDRLSERLLALSNAHNVLTRENWESADVADLVRDAVRAWDDPARARIALSGPPARLAPNVALALAMALHELATNAQKYGAFSVPSGRVTVDWTPDPAGGAIVLEWRESDGPPVRAPAAKGFGSRLLNGLTAELGAPAVIDYAPTGVICRLRAPAA